MQRYELSAKLPRILGYFRFLPWIPNRASQSRKILPEIRGRPSRGRKNVPEIWGRPFRGRKTLPEIQGRPSRGRKNVPEFWGRLSRGRKTLPEFQGRPSRGRKTLPEFQGRLLHRVHNLARVSGLSFAGSEASKEAKGGVSVSQRTSEPSAESSYLNYAEAKPFLERNSKNVALTRVHYINVSNFYLYIARRSKPRLAARGLGNNLNYLNSVNALVLVVNIEIEIVISF